mgnify:FL=1
MYLEKAMLTATQNQKGALFCNAIDENPYDSVEWSNRMPADGYSFTTNVDGSAELTFTHHFACYDGWDSVSHGNTFNSLTHAVAYAWRASFDTFDLCTNNQQGHST